MKDNVCEIIEQIVNQVLSEDDDINRDLYRKRIQLLYSVILEEIINDKEIYDMGGIVEQITLFEQGQLYFTELNLYKYENVTPSLVMDTFSNTAFSLAVEYLKGNNYLGLADLLYTVFQSFISSEGVEIDKMLQSECILDFSFASGNSEIMSLRLKRQWDLMK